MKNDKCICENHKVAKHWACPVKMKANKRKILLTDLQLRRLCAALFEQSEIELENGNKSMALKIEKISYSIQKQWPIKSELWKRKKGEL